MSGQQAQRKGHQVVVQDVDTTVLGRDPPPTAAGALANAPQAKGVTLNLRNVSILIVEDSRFMSGLLASVLKALQVGRVLMADDGEQAQEILQTSLVLAKAGMRFDIDIVLLDREMPRSDGSETLRWIRGHEAEQIRFLPVIMSSGYATETVVREGRDLGATEFLAKPFSVKSLCDRILSVINHPRPYVKAPGFFGPDRRRKVEPFNGDDRRNPDRPVSESHERP